MKREEVKSQIPGITDAQLDWVMNQYGNGINREKATAETLRGQLETAQQQLQTAQEQLKSFEGVDVAQLKGKVKELEDSLSAQQHGSAAGSRLCHEILYFPMKVHKNISPIPNRWQC